MPILAKILDNIVVVLIVVIVILGLLMALQGTRLKALKGDLLDTKLELVEAYRQLDAVHASHNVTVLALEEAIRQKGELEKKKGVVKGRVRDVVKKGSTDTTAELSSSMWDAYCANQDSADCTPRQPTQ
jgi:predicted Holliday junction resolvase-like endonuclease